MHIPAPVKLGLLDLHRLIGGIMRKSTASRRRRRPVPRHLAAHGPKILVFALALGLAFAWFGVGTGLLLAPFVFLGCLPITDRPGVWHAGFWRVGSWRGARACDAATVGPLRDAIDATFDTVRRTGETFACVLVQIDDHALIVAGRDATEVERVTTQCLERIALGTRHDDSLFDLTNGRIAILLTPGPGLDRAAVLALAKRLQAALAEPVMLTAGNVHLSASMGICIDDALTERSGRAMIDASMAATDAAMRAGHSSIRVHGGDGLS